MHYDRKDVLRGSTLSLAGNNDLIQTNWESPPADPMDLMKDWVGQAKEAGIAEPLGMTD